MAYFNLNQSSIKKALFFDKIFLFHFANKLRKVSLIFSLIFFLFFSFQKYFLFSFPFFNLGLFFFFLFFLFLEIDLFFEESIKKSKLLLNIKTATENIEKINIADFLDFETAKIIKKAEKRGFLDSYALLYTILKESSGMDFVFNRALISKKNLIRDLEVVFQNRERLMQKETSSCFQKTLEDALFTTEERGGERIKIEDVFVALYDNNDYLQKTFYRLGLKKKDVFELVCWQIELHKKENPFLYKNLIKRGSLGSMFSAGQTPFLDNFSIDWNLAVKTAGFPESVGHKEEAERLERVLARNEINNVILVGDPGTGRKSIVHKIIKKSFFGEGMLEINHNRFLELDIPSLLAYAKDQEETEIFLNKIFEEVESAGNVVLIINNIHNFIKDGEGLGSINILGFLGPYLHLPSFKVIGITNYLDYAEKIERNSSITSLFEKIEVKEIGEEETLVLMERNALSLEKKYKKLISFSALKKIINLTGRYMKREHFPEKALDLLEEAVLETERNKKNILLPEDVEKIIYEKTEVPVGDIGGKEKEVLLNLENLIHERMIDQDEAVNAVSSALRRSRVDIDTRNNLIGSFLFLGPTGVGKTEMAKAIAAIYFGSEKKINRLDMSEYQSVSDISRIIGTTKENGILTSMIREDPFSLILLDEIEKAHPNILNLFLQVLDEGFVTDGSGRRADFQNCIIIATSNAGYQIILDAVKTKESWSDVKKRLLQYIFQQSIFRPEFVNRFDDVILFKPLSKKDLFDIARLQLQKTVENLKKKDINMIVTEELKNKIVELSYDPVFGAREMQRIIQNNISEVLSIAILKEEIVSGDSFEINPEDFSIKKIN